mmetsp:Transcript_3391/g.7009  ORF Transcript_3391/g.7009 Transcript_3391/m.7009 type:complete len:114 (+) Transcript_3391:537-878(+)
MLAFLNNCFCCCFKRKGSKVYQTSENSAPSQFENSQAHQDPSLNSLVADSFAHELTTLPKNPTAWRELPKSLDLPMREVPKSQSTPIDRYNILIRTHTLRQYVFPRVQQKRFK